MSEITHTTLVSGATFAGLGVASAAMESGRNVVVVERTAMTGQEFIETFNPGAGAAEPATEFGQSFRNEAIRRGLMEESGPVHLPALHPLLCLLIRQAGLKARFLTEIIEVAEQDGRYCVLLYDSLGYRQLIVDEILDTSTLRLTTPGSLFAPERKKLNAYLCRPESETSAVPNPFDDAMTIEAGRFPSEVILKTDIEADCDWKQARQRLYRFWQDRPAEWQSWTIAAVAGAFESTVPAGPIRMAKRWHWLPSESFANPLQALDQGYDIYRKIGGMQSAAQAND